MEIIFQKGIFHFLIFIELHYSGLVKLQVRPHQTERNLKKPQMNFNTFPNPFFSNTVKTSRDMMSGV